MLAFARVAMNLVLILSYIVMAMAEPGKTDWFQYVWLLQLSSALGLYQHHIQYCRLFPRNIGLLVGLSAGLIALSTMVPQLWLYFILEYNTSQETILFIWAGLALLSFIISIFLYPANNLPQDTLTTSKTDRQGFFHSSYTKYLLVQLQNH